MSLADLPMVVERGPGRPSVYRNADGKRVPSVTTILNRAKDSGGLIAWANGLGLEGKTLDEGRKGAADVGSCVHDMIEAHFHGLPVEVPRGQYEAQGVDVAAADEAFGAFLRWREESRLTVIATEVPLVVPGWGGTVDAIAVDPDGRLWVLDWKSAASIYEDNLAQIAAYGHLWTALRGQPIHGGRLLRASKAGSFHEHRYETRHLEVGWRYFTAALELYSASKAIRAVL